MNKQEFLAFSGLQIQTLDFWLEQQWLVPVETASGAEFSNTDVARAHFILDLKNDLGANDEGIDVILHLMDQLHGLRQVLAQLQKDINHPL
jgi:chaperone modulatory protein CbpM